LPSVEIEEPPQKRRNAPSLSTDLARLRRVLSGPAHRGAQLARYGGT